MTILQYYGEDAELLDMMMVLAEDLDHSDLSLSSLPVPPAFIPSQIILGDGSTLYKPLSPYGTTEAIWRAVQSLISGTGGGWTDTGDLQGIDPTKSYRSCVWFQYAGAASGGVYFGCDINGATTNLNGSVDSNPYFAYVPLSALLPNHWYLFVGIIHGSAYTLSMGQSGVSGVYDPSNGELIAGVNGYSNGANVANGSDFVMTAGVTYQTHRAFLYGGTTGSDTQGFFARPRFEEMNGTEPSIQALMPSISTGFMLQTAATNVQSFELVGPSTITTGPTGNQFCQFQFPAPAFGDSSWTVSCHASWNAEFVSGFSTFFYFQCIQNYTDKNGVNVRDTVIGTVTVNSSVTSDTPFSLSANFPIVPPNAVGNYTINVTFYTSLTGFIIGSSVINVDNMSVFAEMIKR